MRKIEFKTHIQTKWKYYLLGIIISLIISSIGVSIASYPKRNERISLFITCESYDESFNDYIESLKSDYLEMIDLNIKDKDDVYYFVYLQNLSKHFDIAIIPESKLSQITAKEFLELNDDIIDDFTYFKFDYYSFNDVKYGIKVYSKDTKSGILDGMVNFIDNESDEDYYLLINKNSLHMGEYNNSKYNGAINILKGILNYENEKSK